MAEKLQFEGIKAAIDTAKQIITLSTGVIALTVTFLEKIVQPSVGTGAARTVPWMLVAAWISYGLAILFAVWTLMALTGSLTEIDRRANGLSPADPQHPVADAYSDNVQIPARGMVLAFLVAMGLTIATGFFL